jgi:DnaK suppressor protein
MKTPQLSTQRTPAVISRTRQARQRDLQAMLNERQREMQHELQHRLHQESTSEVGNGLDEIEHADAQIQEHIEVALIQMKSDTLQRVREALARLDAGEYGYCAECEGEISEGRLKAMPFALRCKACEEQHEQHTARERRLVSSFELV